MSQIAILGYARTPIGAQNGALREVLPDKLATAALTGATERSGLEPSALARIGVGTLLDAGRGPNPARALILEAGFEERPEAPPTGFAVSAGGGSALEALALLAGELEGDGAAAAVGVDSASLAPYLLPEARHGSRLGHGRVLDSALRDAWVVSDEELPLPALAAVAMQPLELDRARFIEVRRRSLERARAAAGKGEIVTVSVPDAKGGEAEFTADELPGSRDLSKGDEVYAAPLADGAAAVVLTTLERARSMKRADAPRVVTVVRASVESRHAPLAPAAALSALLVKTGRKARDLAAIEVDESLFVGAEAARRELGLGDEQLNPRGGAHAYGHPAGACGIRALVALLAQLEGRGGLGAIAYGTGGGGAIALLVER
jgi:acetyl-CoA C-acetyltransferase